MSSRAPTLRPRAAALTALTVLTALTALAALGAGVVAERTTTPASSASPADGPSAASSGGPAGLADGVVPDGVTVFDDEVPAVARLDPALAAALRAAARDAAADGIALTVTSGWRSVRYQQQLLREAVAQHGSPEEAARWVAPAETSSHVSGDAVDLGPARATAWLSAHGAAHGLCRTYRNEPWHYELRPAARDAGCPPPYADAAHDPRLQR